MKQTVRIKTVIIINIKIKVMATTSKMNLGTETTSLFNYLMGNNETIPEVGKGATVLHWTDRSAYEVIEISKDGKQVKIQRYAPERLDKLGMSDCQEYKYEKLTDEILTLVYRNKKWKIQGEIIQFTKEFTEQNTIPIKALSPEQKEEIYQGDIWPRKVVEGITETKKQYSEVKIIFGTKQEYYDYSF